MKRILILLFFINMRLAAIAQINASDTVIFDLSRASCTGTHFIVPVSFKSNDVIYAIDFSMKYNQSKISYNSIINHYPSTVSAAANYNVSDSTLRFTSFCMTSMAPDTQIVSVRFNLLSGPVLIADFNTVQAYLNGDMCSYKIIPALSASIAAGGPTVISSGDTLSLTGTQGSGLTYLWSTGASTPSINVTVPGIYMVTVTTEGGCSSSAFITVTPGAPLPVELLDFTAAESNDAVLIEWATASEINNDYFTVERTADGDPWEELEKIQGAGNSNTVRNYSVTDARPFAGINYYRLKQTDFDGTFSYSEIVPVNFREKHGTLSVRVFPNPAKEMLNIMSNEVAAHQLVDAKGQLVMLIQNTAGIQQVSTGKLADGIYFLKTFNENGTVTNKIVIKNE